MDQRVREYETWDDLSTTASIRPIRAGGSCSGCCGGSTSRTRCGERFGLHRAPARELPPGRAARSRARARVPAGEDRRTFGDPPLDRPTDGAARAAPVRGAARGGAARRGRGPARAHRRAARSRSRALLPRRAGGARRARMRPAGTSSAAAEAVACPARARGGARPRAVSADAGLRGGARITRREAKNFAYGIMVLPRDKRRAIATIYAFARRSTTSPTDRAAREEKRARLEEIARRARRDAARSASSSLSPTHATRFRIPRERARSARRRRAAGYRAADIRRLRRAARLLREGRRRGRPRVRRRCTAQATRSTRRRSASRSS